MTPDLGNVAKVAKKEGVFEVVEADDRHEKAPSSGSQFSEISVKDESEETNKNGQVEGQILLDDQSETQTEHVRGAVGEASQPQLREIRHQLNASESEIQRRPISMADQHQLPNNQIGINSLDSANERNTLNQLQE